MDISIKTLDDAYKAKGINPKDCNITIAGLPEKYHTAIIAFASLVVITDAINEEVSPGWKPDWQDEDQWKYYPWFEMDNSASGFSFDDSSPFARVRASAPGFASAAAKQHGMPASNS